MRKLRTYENINSYCRHFRFQCTVSLNADVVTYFRTSDIGKWHSIFYKGMCYHPVPKGSDNRSFDKLTEDLALMKEAGINTIRVYSPIDEKVCPG